MKTTLLPLVILIIAIGIYLSVRKCDQKPQEKFFYASFLASPLEGIEPLDVSFQFTITSSFPVTFTVDLDGDKAPEIISGPVQRIFSEFSTTFLFPGLERDLIVVQPSAKVWSDSTTLWERTLDIRVFLLPSPQIWPIALTCSATLHPETDSFKELFIFIITYNQVCNPH